jgi:hypothetical protein
MRLVARCLSVIVLVGVSGVMDGQAGSASPELLPIARCGATGGGIDQLQAGRAWDANSLNCVSKGDDCSGGGFTF